MTSSPHTPPVPLCICICMGLHTQSCIIYANTQIAPRIAGYVSKQKARSALDIADMTGAWLWRFLSSPSCLLSSPSLPRPSTHRNHPTTICERRSRLPGTNGMANRETRVYLAVHSMSATQQPSRGAHPSDILLIQQMVLLINLLSKRVRLMG